MELKLLSYEESGKAYAQGTADFDKRLPPLVETESITLRKIGVETENEDMWGVRAANLAQAQLTYKETTRQWVEEFDRMKQMWTDTGKRLASYQGVIEQMREACRG